MPTVEIIGIGEFDVEEGFSSLPIEEQDRRINELKQQASQPATQPASPAPTQQQAGAAAASDDIVKRGEILPIGQTASGEVTAAVPGAIQRPMETIKGILEGRITAQDISPGELLELGATLAGGAPGSIAARAAPKAAPGSGQAVREAGERLGVDIPPAVTTDSTVVQQGAGALANVPGAGTPLVTEAERTLVNLGDAVTTVQRGFGRGQPGVAGEKLRGGLETQITQRTKERIDNAFEEVAAVVDPDVKSPLIETMKVANAIIKARKNAKLPDSKAVNQVLDAVTAPEGLNFQGLKDLRTNIGEQIDRPTALPAKTSLAELKRLYATLTRDLESAATRGGGDEGRAAFDSFNAFVERLSSTNRSLATILGAESNEQILARTVALASKTGTRTSRADLKKLAQVRRAVDNETWDEIASATIATLGRDKEGDFSPNRFLSGYNSLSDGGKRILFSSTNKRELASAIDDIATVSSRFKELQRFAQPTGGSQTGRIAASGAIVGGLVMEPLTAISTVVGGRVVAEALAGTRTARTIANWAKIAEQFARGKRSRDVMSRATRILAVSLADINGMPESAGDIAAQIDSQIGIEEPIAADDLA